MAVLWLTASTAFAQVPGAGAPGGVNASLAKLFGDITGFSAKADVQVLDPAQKETTSAPIDFALLNKSMRVQIDMAQVKSKDLLPGAVAGLKQMGMNQIVSIMRPDQKQLYLIYPVPKTMLVMPLANAEAADKPTKIQKTPLGKETIDGHPCVKNKVVLSDDKGPVFEAVTWNATDLKDFPVQIRTQEKENTSVIHYHHIQFVRPDAKQFEPPAGYTQYKDPQEMMMGLMKAMGGAGGSK